MKRNWWQILGWMSLTGAIVLSFSLCAAYAAGITLGAPVATSDGGMEVSVTVAPGARDTVAAMQFDLHYDAGQYGLSDTAAGSAAADSGKNTLFSEPEPGIVRVVVAGINQDALAAGTVATLYFKPTDGAQPDAAAGNFSLNDVVASNPFGDPAAVEVSGNPDPAAEDTNTDPANAADGAANQNKAAVTTAGGAAVSTQAPDATPPSGRKQASAQQGLAASNASRPAAPEKGGGTPSRPFIGAGASWKPDSRQVGEGAGSMPGASSSTARSSVNHRSSQESDGFVTSDQHVIGFGVPVSGMDSAVGDSVTRMRVASAASTGLRRAPSTSTYAVSPEPSGGQPIAGSFWVLMVGGFMAAFLLASSAWFLRRN